MTQIRDKMNVTASWNIWGIKFNSRTGHQTTKLRNDAIALFLSFFSFWRLSFICPLCRQIVRIRRNRAQKQWLYMLLPAPEATLHGRTPPPPNSGSPYPFRKGLLLNSSLQYHKPRQCFTLNTAAVLPLYDSPEKITLTSTRTPEW